MELILQNIYKSFGNKEVLKAISFHAKSGQIYGLLGRNGAGKTTTFRVIMNILNPDEGDIWLDGKPINYDVNRIGYLPENSGMYSHRSVISQLIYFAVLRGASRKEAMETSLRLLQILDAEEYANSQFFTLSKGNQQKVKLVAATLHDPQILILDELFSGLDPVNASLIKNFVLDFAAKGKIILFSSHQMNYVEEFCREIGILHEGRIKISGTIENMKRHFRRNEIQICSQSPEKIQECINIECGSLISNCRIIQGGIIVTLRESDMFGELRRYLLSNDSLVEGFFVLTPTLSEIFVEYTGGNGV